MRWLALVTLTGGAALTALHGCGLDVVGYADTLDRDGSLPVDGALVSPSDAAAIDDARQDAPSCTCERNVPDGFAVVAVGEQATPCPAGFSTEDRLSDPTPDGATCTCDGSCTITTPPTCAATQWRTTKDDNLGSGTCDVLSAWYSAGPSPGSCVNESGNLARHSQVLPPTLQGGLCTAAGVPNAAAVKTTPIRICQPSPTSCTCDLPSFDTCFAAAGDVACPPQAPKKRLVGSKVDVTCGACGCTVGGSCFATVERFKNDDCDGSLGTVNSLSCQSQANASFRSYRYQAEPRTTCATTGPAPNGVVTLEDIQTVCCP